MSDTDKHLLFSRRAFILGGFQAFLLSTIVGRMYFLEVVSHKHYQKLSDKNRIHLRLIAPMRGQIYDRWGHILATNHNTYRAIMVCDQMKDWRATLQSVQHILQLQAHDLARLQKEVAQKPKFMPIAVKEGLSWAQVTQLELRLPELEGLFVEAGRNRFYPHARETCHFLGYVGAPSQADLDGDPLLQLPGFKVGKNGLEKAYGVKLRGFPGMKQVEVNVHGRIVRELSTADAIPGEDLTLSIDLALQKQACHALATVQSGAAIVMDVETGEVLVYASVPGYDTNIFTRGISIKEWEALRDHPQHVLLNKPIAGQYAPGSTFKMVVALAALEVGIIQPHTSVFCGGHTSLGHHKFHCWKKDGHGPVQLETAIAQSCDVFFYHIASLISIDSIAKMCTEFGLGETTGIDMGGEKRGVIPSRTWKEVMMGKKWHLGETYNASIGQGYVLTTPLQLAVMTARLASGRAVVPRLTPLAEKTANFPLLNVNPAHLRTLSSAMNRVVNRVGGTAYGARILTPGQEMAGKTGTTQVRRITLEDRRLGRTDSRTRPWHHRDHAMFVGFAPVSTPKYAVAVVVEHGVSGGRVAAPIARDLLQACQK